MSSEPESCNEPELEVIEEEIICETVYEKSDGAEDDYSPHSPILEGQRPVRPVERQKMRPWLIELLDANTLPGLSWQNKKENIFRISWKHAAHNCFNRNKDSDLFERWAYHTGRHHEGNHKRWKANFRCALNSLPDVMELKDLGVRKGDNAFKVYKFLDSPEPTMKEKMEIKRKYSLMAGIKPEESQSGSSTPTNSTAPSSPDKEGQTGADGGILTLLKAIELKSLQQKDTKTPQKRGAGGGGGGPGRGKRARKENKGKETTDSIDPEMLESVIIGSGRPSPASTPGSDTGTTKLPIIDPKTGKMTIVELRKAESPLVVTETSSADMTKLFTVNPNVLQTIQTESPAPVVTPPIQITTPPPESLTEKSIAIPLHLLQNELQKQTGILNLSALLSGNTLTQLTKQIESGQVVPLTVLDQINQARLAQQKKQDLSTTTATETLSSVPQPQVNRNITSIAAALRMSSPGTVSPTVSSHPVTTFSVAQDPQGIRSKLVSRLMVSGSTMTNQNTNIRMPVQSPTSTPRPRLDQILVKPNPILTLPKTQLQPVRTTDVVLATASSSHMDVLSGSASIPKLIPGSERTLGLNSLKGQLILPSSTITKEPEIGSSPSPVCTPELRPDILDKQVTIELSKMEVHKPPEETQHYRCLWCQINFEKKSDLLHHFLQLHQDMLVVPGEGQSQNPSQEVVSDISTSAPITVPDVSSTSSDLVTTIPEANIEEDEDDEPPVIIDVMINTSQGEQLQPTSSTTTVDQNLSSIPHDELSNTSTISATESLDSTSKPKCTLNDLIKALSDSLEQDQEKNSQMSVMMSPALQYFNLAQATALQTDPGLSGIPSTVTSGTVSSPRGRGRGRGRGNGRGRGRRKTADVSPEMPELTPEAHQKSDICYDNLPDSTDSENEGPPRITKILPKRSPKDKSRAAQTKHSPAPPTPLLPTRDEPFIPSHLTPQTKVGKAEGEEEEVDDASNQAIHVTVKMYEYNGKTMYKCTECGKSFTKTCTFARHAMLHSKMYPYQCGICDMKCGDMRILLRHLDQHAEDADCPCQKCERMNKDFHIETHKKVSTTFHFKCNLCGKKFFSDYACKIHVNAHKRKLTLTCEQCKLEFRCNRILSRHRKAVHDVQYCPVCLETCSNLISHMQQHIGFTLYRCGLCGDGFNSRPHLHDHLKIHTQLGTTTSSSGVGRTTPLSGSSTPRLCPSPIPETSSGQGKVKTILMEQLSSREDKEASDTLVALSCGVGSIPSTISGDVPLTEMGKEQLTTVTPDLESNREQSPNLFIVRTGEYEDEAGEIDVHVIPRTRRERFQSKSKDDKDISIEPATPSAPKRQISRRCRWHGNDSLCERCDDNLVKKVSSNRKRRGSATRGRRGSKSPRSDYSDTQSLRLNSDSLDSLKNLEVSLPLANYILKGGDDTIIELSD